jgi:hypothetical protein
MQLKPKPKVEGLNLESLGMNLTLCQKFEDESAYFAKNFNGAEMFAVRFIV